MNPSIPDILGRIIRQKALEVEQATISSRELEKLAQSQVAYRRSFSASLKGHIPAVIAEIKKASPSKGVLSDDFRPSETAVAYEAGGAAALSVLTDQSFFQGCLGDLRAARSAVALPVLRKDFTTGPYHVLEAAANGADAILLIAAVLDVAELRSLRELAESFSMDALVEVHNAPELEAALESDAKIIGVNNRNLHTFEVTLDTSLSLAEKIPGSKLKVSESGIENRDQIKLLQNAGFSAFLIGEHLMRSGNPQDSLRQLLR